MKLIKAISTISFFIAISRILGFIRDILIASFLGVGALSDIFFAAFRLPNFFRRIFAEGAFNAAFVPAFNKKLDQSTKNKKAINFAQNICSILIYTILILIIILQIIMPWFIKGIFPGFAAESEKINLLITLSRITIFYLLFITIVSLFSAILNSLDKFASASSAPIILNATLIASIFFLSSITPNLAYALSWGVFIAGILQIFWVGIFLYKKGILIYPKIPKFSPEIKKFLKKFFSGIIGANVMQLNLLIDSLIASFFAGAISYIYYADRVNQLPLAIIGIAINIALLPKISKKIKSEPAKAVSLQNAAIEIGLLLALPAAAALFFLSQIIIEVLFQRGQFGQDQTLIVAECLKLYAIALPAYILVKILEPSFFARENTKTPMKIAIVCVVINIICNLLLFKPFGYKGIIIASIFSSYLNLSLLLLILIKKKYFYFTQNIWKIMFKISVPVALMILCLLGLIRFLEHQGMALVWQLIMLI
ncbi:murein biosynthesis integral membrane protein MurJ, partial [Flavobacteriaceae bacterium]|nr:murein biosynthesis integral membrane protein MurJ [Flavobacteriaceae bacterium]